MIFEIFNQFQIVINHSIYTAFFSDANHALPMRLTINFIIQIRKFDSQKEHPIEFTADFVIHKFKLITSILLFSLKVDLQNFKGFCHVEVSERTANLNKEEASTIENC